MYILCKVLNIVNSINFNSIVVLLLHINIITTNNNIVCFIFILYYNHKYSYYNIIYIPIEFIITNNIKFILLL
jgi:hypothetical protein